MPIVSVVMLVHLSPAPNSVATSGCTTLHQISQGCTRLYHCLSSSGGASLIDKMDFDIKKTGLIHGYLWLSLLYDRRCKAVVAKIIDYSSLDQIGMYLSNLCMTNVQIISDKS